MKRFRFFNEGKKQIIEMDGYQYAVYASSPYHLYTHEGGQWRRIKAPAKSYKCAWFGNSIIGNIFAMLQYCITLNNR